MQELIEKAKKLSKHIDTLINPLYLINKYSGKTIDEIKSERTDKTQQLPAAAQRELSIRGNRTAFIEFHRFMYSLTYIEMESLKTALKKYYTDKNIGEDANTYNDFNIIKDVTDWQMCSRDNNIMVCPEIAQSYRTNQRISENFPDVTSQHLIDFTKRLLDLREYRLDHSIPEGVDYKKNVI